MHLNIHEKYQLLVAVLKTAIDAAKQNDKPELKRLEELKKTMEQALVTSELKGLNAHSKTKNTAEDSLKTTYQLAKKELNALLGKLNSKIDVEKLLKPSEKTYKKIKEGKRTAFSFADIVAHVQKQLMDALNLQLNDEVSSDLESSSQEEKPSSSGSAQLRAKYEQQRPRKFSFYKNVPALNIAVASSSKTKPSLLSPHSPRPLQEDNLTTYFDDFFACDSEKTSQFVIALATQGYSWGIQALNAASDKEHHDIAKTLFENLSEPELVHVFAEVFKLDPYEKWCRGNQLIYTLLQQYMAQPSLKEYRKLVWDTVFMLRPAIDKISIKQRDSIQFTAKNFSAAQQDINALQHAFTSAVKQILAPENIPPLMQEIIKCAYYDLLSRSEVKRDYGTLMRTLMTPFVLRFICPLILAEAEKNLTLDNLNTLGAINLQTENNTLCEEKLIALKTWYKTISTAIQALNSPLKNTNEKQSKPQAIWIDQQLEEQSLATAMFEAVTQDEALRIELYTAIEKGLQLKPISSITPTYDDSKIPSFNRPDVIEKLSELFLTEKFSGVIVRKDGAVLSPRKEDKISIFSIFKPEPSPRNDSEAPINSPR
ncbi:hypothetical protein ACD661_12950 [Legionella lytica]|uniref:RasGEF domain protein n=1 Tax=Legionella lytica TaxID=96232 RepID=A0ABW8D9T8_9GAMM